MSKPSINWIETAAQDVKYLLQQAGSLYNRQIKVLLESPIVRIPELGVSYKPKPPKGKGYFHTIVHHAIGMLERSGVLKSRARRIADPVTRRAGEHVRKAVFYFPSSYSYGDPFLLPNGERKRIMELVQEEVEIVRAYNSLQNIGRIAEEVLASALRDAGFQVLYLTNPGRPSSPYKALEGHGFGRPKNEGDVDIIAKGPDGHYYFFQVKNRLDYSYNVESDVMEFLHMVHELDRSASSRGCRAFAVIAARVLGPMTYDIYRTPVGLYLEFGQEPPHPWLLPPDQEDLAARISRRLGMPAEAVDPQSPPDWLVSQLKSLVDHAARKIEMG